MSEIGVGSKVLINIIVKYRSKFNNLTTRMYHLNIFDNETRDRILNNRLNAWKYTVTFCVPKFHPKDYIKYEFETGTETVRIQGDYLPIPENAGFTYVTYLDQPILAYRDSEIFCVINPNDVYDALTDKAEFIDIYKKVLLVCYSEVYNNTRKSLTGGVNGR